MLNNKIIRFAEVKNNSVQSFVYFQLYSFSSEGLSGKKKYHVRPEHRWETETV